MNFWTGNVDHLIAVCEQRAAEEKARYEWAPGHSKQRAWCDRARELSKRDYQLVRDIRRAENKHLTLFVMEILFENLDDALVARRELIAAGYEFEIRPEVDPYSRTIFTEVYRSSRAGPDEDELWNQLQAIVEPFGGTVDNGGLIEDPLKEQQLHRLH